MVYTGFICRLLIQVDGPPGSGASRVDPEILKKPACQRAFFLSAHVTRFRCAVFRTHRAYAECALDQLLL